MTTLRVANKIATFVHYVNSKGGGGKRGVIKTFSIASFRRLRKLVLSLEEQPTLFITLTYPKFFPTARVSKKHLDIFFKALSRFAPDVWAIWKLEPQKRGAPHFHLLVGGISLLSKRDFDIFKEWLTRTWFRVVGSGDKKHLKAGTQVVNLEYEQKKGQNIDLVTLYVSKYFSKPVESIEGWDNPGRFWGVHNRKALQIREHVYVITKTFFYKCRRVFRTKMYKYLRLKGKKVRKSQIFSFNFSCIFKDLEFYLWSIFRLARLWGESIDYCFTSRRGV